MKELKKALVVGGSNGIGLAISGSLMEKGYHIIIVDKSEPDQNAFVGADSFTYINIDLNTNDMSIFEELAKDMQIEILMITAGFGRVADFEYLHPTEIESLLRVNTISGIKIISYFYERIKNSTTFYSGIMGSISGFVSSPMFSVYAASKAAICRFIESVNIEIGQAGFSNRILNISPGSISGSNFNGGNNQLRLLEKLAEQIIESLFNSRELLIPDYETTYKSVFENYRKSPYTFGVNSYQYKKNSGRVRNEKRIKIGYLSGTFDLFHVGHLNLIKKAKNLCDYLIVGVHPDALHKGKETFISYEERVSIVESCRFVDKVVKSCKEDSDAWTLWNYDCLFVGSDYEGTERFNRYEDFFKDKGVKITYFPYTEGTSSTQIRNTITEKTKSVLGEET